MHFLPENRMCAPPFATKQRPPIWKILDPPLWKDSCCCQTVWRIIHDYNNVMFVYSWFYFESQCKKLKVLLSTVEFKENCLSPSHTIKHECIDCSHTAEYIWRLFEFSLNVFTEISDNKYYMFKKIIRTCHLLCNRPRFYHSASKTQQRGSLNWA